VVTVVDEGVVVDVVEVVVEVVVDVVVVVSVVLGVVVTSPQPIKRVMDKTQSQADNQRFIGTPFADMSDN
jgi:hypothetical protein